MREPARVAHDVRRAQHRPRGVLPSVAARAGHSGRAATQPRQVQRAHARASGKRLLLFLYLMRKAYPNDRKFKVGVE